MLRYCAALAALALLLVPSAAAQTMPEPFASVTVQGEGLVKVEPDQAVITFSIVTLEEDPEAARAANAEASAAAMNAVRDLGVPERMMQVEALRLQQKTEYDRDRQRSIPVGFEAVRRVSVTLDDLEQLPALVARVVQGGANRLDEVRYTLKDRQAAREEALRQAARDARAKAEVLASTLGAELGRVHQIEETGFDVPAPVFRMEARALMADAAPQPDAYAAGELEVRANVRVVFRLQ
jgi:uncharacterized protein YggE